MEKIIEESRKLLKSIDQQQVLFGFISLKVEEFLNNEENQVQYGTFKSFLAECGQSLKQITPFKEAARWCEEVGISKEEAMNIPVSKLYLLARLETPMSDDLLYNLKELSYSDLKIMYGQNN